MHSPPRVPLAAHTSAIKFTRFAVRNARVYMLLQHLAYIKTRRLPIHRHILPLQPRTVRSEIDALSAIEPLPSRQLLQVHLAALAAHDDKVLAVPPHKVQRAHGLRHAPRVRKPRVGLGMEVLLRHRVWLGSSIRYSIEMQDRQPRELREFARIFVLCEQTQQIAV